MKVLTLFGKKTASIQPMRLSMRVVEEAYIDIGKLLARLNTRRKGLTDAEVKERLRQYGLNEVAHEKPPHWVVQLLQAFNNPFVYILLGLAIVSFLTEDLKGTIVLTLMVVISGLLRFVQEFRSTQAAAKLKAMVSTTATVSRRDNTFDRSRQKEVPIQQLVPGDIVHLSAGDMVPADARLLTAKDLFVSQAILTGESLPVEKYDTLGSVVEKMATSLSHASTDPLDTPTVVFMGTNIVSGTAMAVVVATGSQTYFGSLAKNLVGKRSLTSFEKGVKDVSWLLIGFMAVMVPIVFLLNGIGKGNWGDAFLFAVSVAVGLTPEMLPMIVTANLARGAVVMADQKVVVKRLNAIQNFGAMDVLCTDKTGTLTQDKIILERHLDIYGQDDETPLKYGYLNSYYQTGLKNLLDAAVLEHGEMNLVPNLHQQYQKVDEVPFDFIRRRMSVIVEEQGQHLLICKGAVEEIVNLCTQAYSEGDIVPLTGALHQQALQVTRQLNEDGLRVIAVAYRQFSEPKSAYSAQDEFNLTLVGYLAFLDPPKDSAEAAIAALQTHGVNVKVITGDNDLVTRKVCREVGLYVHHTLLGHEVEQMSDQELGDMVETTTVFAKMSPLQKARIIQILKRKGHTVGYLGDGINDAAALRDADVGISVDTAVDIAKESADIILLEKSLMVLERGILEGRRTFANILKYLNMTASSNFGNVFSVMGSSAILPFLPMQPIHLLIQNLLYDISQVTIPFDQVDREFLERPQKWNVPNIGRFMIFIGPISSIFDYATYGLMWFVFGANTPEQASLFQSGWFVEGLLSQTLIIHMIRTAKVPFFQSTAALPVIVTTGIIMAIGIAVPFTAFGASVGMMPLPFSYFPWLIAILGSYCVLTQTIKVWYIRKFGKWL
ncbi:MAG: magnesium-translocating P-type ATPase [Leptolyngbyaceae cyanobacterium HOT.MB2.61]|nr:magnesium-translocating P-type ATPase [Leptolyngbyaceae cyanobacterium HOT.MB2.61]